MDDTLPASPPPSRWRWPALAILTVATCVGAWQLAFLCDDAFITFRYVANAHDGYGLVWNRPPWAPVEGYTGFSWALLLWAVWSWLGIEPPAAANWLSAACGVLQFAVLAAAAFRLRRKDGARASDLTGILALAVVVGNRSFLQWLTGGLETALFNLAFVAWVVLAFARRADSLSWLLLWSGAAALAALTRPDGLLLCAATFAVAAMALVRRRVTVARFASGLLPLAGVAAHLLWRRSFYGEWLPNTYYAKVVEPWPEAGVRYAACFALEHGTWLVAGLAIAWAIVEHLRNPRCLWRCLADRTAASAAVAACLVHAGYYVFRVGGDHFEYRVFSQFVPLLVLATAAMGLRLIRSEGVALAALLGLGIASGAGWVQLALTRDLPDQVFQPIAARVPSALRPIARWFDRQQAWLTFQNVGLRCQHHGRLFTDVFQAAYPHRLKIDDPPDPFPVCAASGLGVVGWSLPDCAIIDRYGLNDWVVARTPVQAPAPTLTREVLRRVIDTADTVKDGWFDAAELRTALGMLGGDGKNDPDQLVVLLLAIFAHERPDAMTLEETEHISDLLLHARSMAHERQPPPGYVEAFEPNVTVVDGKAIARPRQVPMTAERVRAIEREWRERVRTGTLPR